VEEVRKLVIRRPQNRNVERSKKIVWLRNLRERTQYLSVAFRPQTVRTIMMKKETEASQS